MDTKLDALYDVIHCPINVTPSKVKNDLWCHENAGRRSYTVPKRPVTETHAKTNRWNSNIECNLSHHPHIYRRTVLLVSPHGTLLWWIPLLLHHLVEYVLRYLTKYIHQIHKGLPQGSTFHSPTINLVNLAKNISHFSWRRLYLRLKTVSCHRTKFLTFQIIQLIFICICANCATFLMVCCLISYTIYQYS